ncbi:MAG: hypothetical protein PHQ12_03520 [Chthoniobacteraceae bacterium]|nr:hypothetical protein [Chthoniobacteraceae bacterium]
MRRYDANFYQHGHHAPDGWTGRSYTSNAKIGVVVRVLFRKWFGRSPDRYVWHKDGWMGEARDKRGNVVYVYQNNGHDGFQQDLTRLALPWKGVSYEPA